MTPHEAQACRRTRRSPPPPPPPPPRRHAPPPPRIPKTPEFPAAARLVLALLRRPVAIEKLSKRLERAFRSCEPHAWCRFAAVAYDLALQHKQPGDVLDALVLPHHLRTLTPPASPICMEAQKVGTTRNGTRWWRLTDTRHCEGCGAALDAYHARCGTSWFCLGCLPRPTEHPVGVAAADLLQILLEAAPLRAALNLAPACAAHSHAKLRIELALCSLVRAPELLDATRRRLHAYDRVWHAASAVPIPHAPYLNMFDAQCAQRERTAFIAALMQLEKKHLSTATKGLELT